jgi:hypothetical protein
VKLIIFPVPGRVNRAVTRKLMDKRLVAQRDGYSRLNRHILCAVRV